MKLALLIAAIVLQFTVLVYMAAHREWVVRYGRVIQLCTVPFDPRDLMRGDYVKLHYEISDVPKYLLAGAPVKAVKPGTKVYATLQYESCDYTVTALTRRRPTTGLYLKGFVERNNPESGRVTVRYGIEAYFMQQDTALNMESYFARNDQRAILNVAVGADGTAALKGFQLQPISILVTKHVSDANSAHPPVGAIADRLDVALRNDGTNPIAIVDVPNGRSIALKTATVERFKWANAGASVPPPTPDNVIVLQPGQSHTIHINLTDSYWFVENTSDKLPTPVSLADTERRLTSFELIYRPPDQQACDALPHQELIWHGRAISRFLTTNTTD